MRLRRERDVLDVVVLLTVAALAFQHLPWRDLILAFARRAVTFLLAAPERAGFEVFVVVCVALALGFLVYLTQVMPRRG